MRVFLLLTALLAPVARAGEWSELPPLPDRQGFAGSLAGVSDGALLVAGGANFPDKKPWEGGKKVWYDTVFVLDKPDGKWVVAGKLPRPLGYGVSVNQGGTVVCVGGGDAERHYADVFRLEWRGGRLATTALPPMPKPLAYLSGALVGNVLFVAGGQEKPDATSTSRAVYQLDLSASTPAWREVAPYPGPGRMLAATASFGGAFWLAGGVDLRPGKDGMAERRYLTDAYRYTPGKGWERVADLPRPVVAAPSPAPVDATGFYLLGGDDGSQVSADPTQHRGFPRTILRYDTRTAKWVPVGETPPHPRVVAPCVPWAGGWVVPSGEVRPGGRSPAVSRFSPGGKD